MLMKHILIQLLFVFLFLIYPYTIAVAADEIEAITQPSDDVMLSFVRGGRISKILVKEGDMVKKKQLLARQEEKAEQIRLEQLTAKARDITRIQEGEARKLQKEKDLQKLEWAQTKGAATDWEVEHARLDVRLAELALQMAKFEHKQDGLKRDEAKVLVSQLSLLSPVIGVVEEIAVDPGEAAQALTPVIRVVQIDPLRIDVQVPLTQVQKMKKGQNAYIRFPGNEADRSVKGLISFISNVAHAASDTLKVRVEVPNPSLRPAGERVTVNFDNSHTQ